MPFAKGKLCVLNNNGGPMWIAIFLDMCGDLF